MAYSSIIASKARIKLNKEIINLIKNGWDIYYYDTDSIFAGHDQNWLNKSIGEVTWSNIYDDAVFISPKFYHLKNEDMKSKGVKNSKYTFDDTKNKFYNNEKIIFENQLQFNKSNYILEQKYISKEINTNFYDKRIFTNDKKKTKSIII